jgi:hypothetical protein
MEWDMTTKPLVLVLVLGCQGGNLTLPADGSPGRLRAVSGFDQEGLVGTELPRPLVVQVMDGANRPVAGVTLRFRTDVPAARLTPAETATDDSGYAAATVRLGVQEGTQSFEAHLADAAELRTTFTLVAFANHPPDDGEDDDDERGGGGNGNRGGDNDSDKGKDKGGGHGHGGHGHDHDHHGDDD